MTRVLACEPASPGFACHALDADPSICIKIIISAHLLAALPPSYTKSDDLAYGSFPSGAPNSPSLRLPSDDFVFRNCMRHSDFDMYVLSRSRAAAVQFVRWKQCMLRTGSTLKSGDKLRGCTNLFSRRFPRIRPRYPCLKLPTATANHLLEHRRPRCEELETRLTRSARFSIALGRELTPRVGRSMARTFLCHITSLDGRSVAPGRFPDLCIKLFDDRYHALHDQNVPNGDLLPFWCRQITTAETLVAREHSTYLKLEHAQGSLVPRYYGAHAVGGAFFGARVKLTTSSSCSPTATRYTASSWSSCPAHRSRTSSSTHAPIASRRHSCVSPLLRPRLA